MLLLGQANQDHRPSSRRSWAVIKDQTTIMGHDRKPTARIVFAQPRRVGGAGIVYLPTLSKSSRPVPLSPSGCRPSGPHALAAIWPWESTPHIVFWKGTFPNVARWI